MMRRTSNFPSPDNYNPMYRTTVNKSPTWGFGTSKRPGLTAGKNCAPSMQTYNIPSKAVEGSAWHMGLKLEKGGAMGVKSVSPGPGTYNGNYRVQAASDPTYTLKGRYPAMKRLNVPGPGTYEKKLIDKKSAPSFGFGSSPQREGIRKTLSPGPGGYRIPSTIGALQPYTNAVPKDDMRYV